MCAGALPVALGVATARRRALMVGGALAGWLLLTTVALTANRTGIGLCALAATGCVALAPRRRPVGPVALATIGAAAASALILHGDLARAGDGARLLALLPGALVVAAALWAGGAARNARGRWTAIVGIAALVATAAVVLGDRGSPCGADPSHGRVGIWRAALHTAGERPLQGFGAGTFLAATRERQLRERPVPTRFAHDLPLQEWVELGIGGLLAVVAWYLAVGWTLAREARPGAGERRGLAAGPGGRGLPAGEPARLAVGPHRDRRAVGGGRRRPADRAPGVRVAPNVGPAPS